MRLSDLQLTESVWAAWKNGCRLLDEARSLQDFDYSATAYFLYLIAQEELAKSFLLLLVSRGVIPWNQHVRRAAKDHECKQLLCVIMDHVTPDFDTFVNWAKAIPSFHEIGKLPAKVADAINILRYEKIGRWESSRWDWAEDPNYDASALNVAEGKQEKRKQDSLYVRIGSDGTLASTPAPIADEVVNAEAERGSRFATLVKSLIDSESNPGIDYDVIQEAFRMLFTPKLQAKGVAGE